VAAVKLDVGHDGRITWLPYS